MRIRIIYLERIWEFEILDYIYIVKHRHMNLMPFLFPHLLVQQLRKAMQNGWLYAIDVC